MTAVLALTAWAILGGILVRWGLRRIEADLDRAWLDAARLFDDDDGDER